MKLKDLIITASFQILIIFAQGKVGFCALLKPILIFS